MKYQNQCYMTKSNLETDIFNYKTPEFYINMKNIPDKTSQERRSFVLEEKRKCIEGVNINGIHIPGSLYFHLNYYYLQGDDLKSGKKAVFLPRLRDNEWIFFNDYEESYKNKLSYTFFGLRQAGKDLLNSSKLYCENNEITIGDAKIGDRIYDDSGELTTITGVYPQGIKPVYKITLLDGREILCGLDHNWYVWNRKKSNGYKNGSKKNGRNPVGGYEIKTTRELLLDYKYERAGWINKRKNTYEYKYGIPNSKAVKYPEKKLPIEPYLLGLWLGDGSNYYSKITNIDKEIVEYLYTVAERMNLQITKDGNDTYMITAGKFGNKQTKKNIFHNFLTQNNLYCNKHIPKDYFYSSIEQRMELLRGLMDSDGTVTEKGCISFSSSIPSLAEDFIKLCRSLGIIVSKTINKSGYKKNGVYRRCKDSYDISLYTDKEVFKLSRKKDKCINKKRYLNFTSIVDIQYVFNDYTTCITVDNNSHLFLTDDYTITHNTEQIVSLCLREICLFKDTEALALFSRQPDKDTFVKKISTAITYGEKFIIVPNIDKDWSKEEIRFGFTKQDNTTELRARLFIYNTQEGKKIQISSGKSPSFLLMDEIAINPFRGVYDTIEPGLLSDLGTLRCSPVFTFTGGETEKAKDAENFVKFPTDKQYKTTLENGETIGGRFLSGLYRKDCKEEKTFSEYIGKKTNTWLDDYPIFVSNFDKAQEKIDKEKQEALKSPDRNTFLLKRIFFPLNLDDVFLTESNNKFPLEAIKQHQEWLKNHYEPMYVEFYRDLHKKVQWKFSDKRPIDKFPIKAVDNKDAPVCIYELPVANAPRFTYCIGIDPINSNDSNDKIVSLFSICVYKRMLNPLDEFKNQIVASIAYRPKELEDAHELALMLAEFYNAEEGVLPEASENSIFQYFFLKRKGHFLANSFDLVSEINRKTSFRGKKGLPPTTPNQRHYMNLMVEDANREDIYLNEEGEEILSYGVKKIHDPMLLEEMKEYKSKITGNGVHDINVDRIISYGCALTLARYYDVKYPIVFTMPENKPKEVHKNHTIRTPFGNIDTSKQLFGFDKPKIKLPSFMQRRK